jgi:hypothetical protein
MTGGKTDQAKLQALLDAVEEMVLDASDEEILEDVRLDGRNPETAADELAELIGAQIKAHRQQKLQVAREGYRRSVAGGARRSGAIPDDPAGRRALLHSILVSRADVPKEITMAFREGEDLSDDDVASVLEDLAKLGFLDQGANDS